MRRKSLMWLLLLSVGLPVQAQRLVYLGGPPPVGQAIYGIYNYLSGDGKVVASRIRIEGVTTRYHPAIWTAQDGWWYLKRDGGLTRNPREAIWGYVNAVSYDGRVVVGRELSTNRPFRWWAGRGIEYLSPEAVGAHQAGAAALSWDGGWVAGIAVRYHEGRQSWMMVRWSPTGRAEIVPVPCGTPRDMSADGRVIVGHCYFYGFHWHEEEGVRYSPPFTNPTNAVSADGRIAAGNIHRWLVYENRVEQLVENPGEFLSFDAIDISADGQVIVGSYTTYSDRYVFLWEAGRIFMPIETVYPSLFRNIHAWHVYSISADGRYILLDTDFGLAILDRFGIAGDVNSDDCVDDADLLRVLFAFGERWGRPEDVNADFIVDEQDLLVVLSNFGRGC